MNELDKLRNMLYEANIPFESYQKFFEKELVNGFLERAICTYGKAGAFERNQIIYGRTNDKFGWKIDGICQFGSYGAKAGLIETFGKLGVDSDGEPCVMTAEEVFDIIKNDWIENGGDYIED